MILVMSLTGMIIPMILTGMITLMMTMMHSLIQVIFFYQVLMKIMDLIYLKCSLTLDMKRLLMVKIMRI